MTQQKVERKTKFIAEEIQTALNNLNKGVQFVSVVEVVASKKGVRC